jgi:hypothetical protein
MNPKGVHVNRVLTYMSIREQIQTAINEGWLVNMPPTLPSVPHSRILLVCRGLSDAIETDLNNPAKAVRTAQLLSTFDTYLGGGLITVGGRKHKAAYMKRLEPESEEVWEIRSVDPRPSIRVFGRFAEPDVFVATNMGFRTDLGGFNSKEFLRAVSACKREWRRSFHTWPPYSGIYINDYITQDVVDLRDL